LGDRSILGPVLLLARRGLHPIVRYHQQLDHTDGIANALFFFFFRSFGTLTWGEILSWVLFDHRKAARLTAFFLWNPVAAPRSGL